MANNDSINCCSFNNDSQCNMNKPDYSFLNINDNTESLPSTSNTAQCSSSCTQPTCSDINRPGQPKIQNNFNQQNKHVNNFHKNKPGQKQYSKFKYTDTASITITDDDLEKILMDTHKTRLPDLLFKQFTSKECKLCEFQFYNANKVKVHYNSYRHKRNVAFFIKDNIELLLQQGICTNSDCFKPFYCNACNEIWTGHDWMEEHYASHKQCVEDLSDCSEIDNFDCNTQTSEENGNESTSDNDAAVYAPVPVSLINNTAEDAEEDWDDPNFSYDQIIRKRKLNESLALAQSENDYSHFKLRSVYVENFVESTSCVKYTPDLEPFPDIEVTPVQCETKKVSVKVPKITSEAALEELFHNLEKENSFKYPEVLKAQFKLYKCELCKVQLRVSSVQDHYNSKQHWRNMGRFLKNNKKHLEAWGIDIKCTSYKLFYCYLCDLELPGNRVGKAHYHRRRHWEAVKMAVNITENL